MESNSEYILNIKTIQASTFKQVIDALKEILMDVNLEIDETGIKIVAMDNTHIVLIHLKLEADKFEIYECEKKTYGCYLTGKFVMNLGVKTYAILL